MLNYNLPTIILLLLFTASLQLKVDAAGEEEKDQFYAYNRQDYSDVVNWLKRYGKEIASPAQKICQNQLKKPPQPELAQKLCATVSLYSSECEWIISYYFAIIAIMQYNLKILEKTS